MHITVYTWINSYPHASPKLTCNYHLTKHLPPTHRNKTMPHFPRKLRLILGKELSHPHDNYAEDFNRLTARRRDVGNEPVGEGRSSEGGEEGRAFHCLGGEGAACVVEKTRMCLCMWILAGRWRGGIRVRQDETCHSWDVRAVS